MYMQYINLLDKSFPVKNVVLDNENSLEFLNTPEVQLTSVPILYNNHAHSEWKKVVSVLEFKLFFNHL